MTKHFLRDIEALSDNLLRITASTEQAFARALESVLSRDVETAREVIEGDIEIDRMEVRLEEDALKILALHVPVASDLRFLISAIKINNDLERVADIAANLASRVVELSELPPVSPPVEFEEMAKSAQKMMREAIQALVRRDTDLARKVLSEDDDVDRLQTELLTGIEEKMREAPDRIPSLMRWANVVRNVERVADYATNIAEDIIYMEHGDIVRHEIAMARKSGGR